MYETTTKKKTFKETDAAPRVNILYLYEEHYKDILPAIMDKIRRDKRKEVHTRLDFGDNTKRSRKEWMMKATQNQCGNLVSEAEPLNRLSDTYSPSTTKSGPNRASSRDHSHSRGHPHRRDSSLSRDHPRSRDRSRSIKESYDNTCSSYRTGASHGYHSLRLGIALLSYRGGKVNPLLSRVSEEWHQ
ncbi:hypothetical protein Tco_0627487 [Tanacetum coccineum]|uniref:Uncharacterized protein n=1 Tax=Tanacetum coccineum TaxID=301880 RepID=A0ABQ4WMN8_9ASTR